MTEGDGGSQVLVISCHLNDFFHIYFRFGKHMNKILKKKKKQRMPPGFSCFFQVVYGFFKSQSPSQSPSQ